MPAVAVQARPPRDVKASVDAVLETNNNTRMVSGGNIDYNKLIRADNVPSKSSTAAQHSAESKKDATEAKRPQVWKGEMCLRPLARARGACVKAANRLPDLPLHWPPLGAATIPYVVTIKKRSIVKYESGGM